MPGKAAYLRFEDDSDAEFEFFLAEHLRKTVGEIRTMPHREYVAWQAYLSRKAQKLELEAKSGR